MNIRDFKNSLEYMFKAQVTPFIWGHAGLGKSTVIKQYATEKGYKFFPFYLGTMSDVGDILGLATFVKDENGQEVATKFAIPQWIKEMIEYCEENPESGAIILLDEFNRARRDILNGMFSLALDKTFHTLKLPANCHIIAAGNPPTEEYYVTDVNETALMARFVHIKLEPSFQEWVDYAKKSSFEPTLISFLQEQPDLIEDHKTSFNLPVKVDRRSYERINKLFTVKTPMPILEQLMLGIIGAERLVAYKLHLQSAERPISGEVILNDWDSVVKKVATWANPIDIKSSLLSVTCDNVFDTITNINVDRFTFKESEAENLMKFLEVLPKDIAYTLLRKLYKLDLKIFESFYKDNQVYHDRIYVITSEAQGHKNE